MGSSTRTDRSCGHWSTTSCSDAGSTTSPGTGSPASALSCRDGVYEPRIRLHRAGKTLVLPVPITVDATPPRIVPIAVHPRTISPDGDGHSDVVHVRYRINERAHALLFVNGIQRARTKFQHQKDTIQWYGRVNGHALPPGHYRLSLAAVDRAGNSSRVVPAGVVTIRYVELPVKVIRAHPRSKVVIAVSTDAPKVGYTLRHGSSTVAAGTSRAAWFSARRRAPAATRSSSAPPGTGHARLLVVATK